MKKVILVVGVMLSLSQVARAAIEVESRAKIAMDMRQEGAPMWRVDSVVGGGPDYIRGAEIIKDAFEYEQEHTEKSREATTQHFEKKWTENIRGNYEQE